ncbi:MAG: hypothetical protein J5608_03380 [Alphaproteobacteria bacterium]|nr:hypothetical protein [Alphaproteobacteria bacterium]
MKKLHIGLFLAALMVAMPAYSASKAKTAPKQSAIQQGTKVRAKTEAKGLYKQECYDAYYSCMDQFCIGDNEDGGSCACSDANLGYEKRLSAVRDTLLEAERLKTEEVERVQAGANADIVFKGTREYDQKTGDVVKSTDTSAADKKKKMLSLWDDDEEDDIELFADQKGDALYKSADKLCREQIDEDECGDDVVLLKQMYSRQIISGCKGFANILEKKELEAKNEMRAANSAIRAALKESLDASNKYDRGECMVEYKKCMQKEDACGKDWENCVFTVAAENMQNNEAKSVAKTKVKTIDTYNITPSTMEMLESKRYICERVLDSCVSVRQYVWQDFLREAAPTIKLAESKIESKKRQSCLTDISNCIQKACKDDIAGKGVETMDACLARPDMARSFCKVEIDPCERMEPQIWSYVKDKLAAMRVDVCTQEVKDCFTDETRCGKDFSKCIGMDYKYIHDICPIDSLVVCKQANPKFSMKDLDSMLMGLYLNVDNAILDTCQNLVDEKMTEVCGSTVDCNKFAADDFLGTGSLFSQKDGDVYRVTGMISFGSIKMGDGTGNKDGTSKLDAGEIGIDDYIEHVRENFSGVRNSEAIIGNIEEELNNIAGTINKAIQMIEQDPKIQFCITGRNLEQITGVKSSTTGRFPNLLNQVKIQIAMAALRKAQDNYNKKFNDLVKQATKDASIDVAQYMCQMMPTNGGAPIGGTATSKVGLTEPYAISYDVGVGLTKDLLAQGGRSSSATSQAATATTSHENTQVGAPWAIVSTDKFSNTVELPGGSREMWAIFSRETRTCHFCTSTVVKNCKRTEKSNIFRNNNDMECTESEPVEKCEDIQM